MHFRLALLIPETVLSPPFWSKKHTRERPVGVLGSGVQMPSLADFPPRSLLLTLAVTIVFAASGAHAGPRRQFVRLLEFWSKSQRALESKGLDPLWLSRS